MKQIRKMKAQDLNQVMEIWLCGNLEAHPFVDETYWKDNESYVREAIALAEVLVVEEDGGICAFAGLDEDYIAGIFVKSEYRSKGFGKALLDALKKDHDSLSLHVYEKNERALRFYSREGFSLKMKSVDENTGEAECEMFWSKPQRGVND